MVYSRFNIYRNKNGYTWIFNTLSQGFCKVKTSELSPSADNLSKRVIEILQRSGIIVDDHQKELNKYKFRYYSSMFKTDTLFLTIAPTMRCNFSCPYCFEGNHKTMGKMPKDIESKLVEFITKNSKKEINIIWFGGEPLLAFDTITSISNELNKKDIHYKSSIITNGSLMTKEKSAVFDELRIQSVQITIDGNKNVHDQRRCFSTGKPSFDIIMSNVNDLLNTTDIKLEVEVTTDHSNPKAYEEVLLYFDQNFKKYLDKGQIVIGSNSVLDRTGFDNGSICFTGYEMMLNQLTRKEGGQDKLLMPRVATPCMFRQSMSYAIDPQGNIYKCLELLGREEYRVGNLSEGIISRSEVCNSLFTRDPFEDKECVECAYLPVCGGSCPMDRVRALPNEKKGYCSCYKDNLESILPLFSK